MDIAAIIPVSVPAILATGALVVWWSAALPRIAVGLLCASLVAGQFIRIPILGQSGGVLISDVAVILTLLAALFQSRVRQLFVTRHIRVLVLLYAPFFVWSLFNLSINSLHVELSDAVVAVAYWLRLAAYVALTPALLVLAADQCMYGSIRRYFLAAVIMLSAIGLLQVALLPQVADIGSVLPFVTSGEWDPHSGRLVSTWLDPNFIGLFFVLVIVWLLLSSPSLVVLVATGVSVFAALIATQSRSSVAALLGALIATSPIVVSHYISYSRNKKAAVVILASITSVTIAGALLGFMALGTRFTASFYDDPTVNLRVSAIKEVWRALGSDTAVIGVGYNAYQFAAAEVGLIGSFDLHSRAGSDSSLLTLWVTSGVIGTLLFLLPWIAIGIWSFRGAWRLGSKTLLAPFIVGVAMLIHSQFVNSLLYSHVLITVALIVALSVAPVFHNMKQTSIEHDA